MITLIRKMTLAFSALVCAILMGSSVQAQEAHAPDPGPDPRMHCPSGDPLVYASDPSAKGWTDSDITTLQALLDGLGTSAFLLMKDGEVIVSYGHVNRLYLLHSIRKSIMSALIGTAVDDGVISLDATLADMNINDITPLTDQELSASVEDIITARSGVYIPSAAETEAMRNARPERGEYLPGEHWYYNNWDFNVAGYIFEHQTMVNYNSAFQTAFADPLCMPDFDIRYTYREPAADTIFTAYHMRMSARDLALFGQLYLQNGVWNGQQILSSDWISQSTSPITSTNYADSPLSGYGYMWWTLDSEETAERLGLPADAYSAAGYGGHFLTVIPSRNLVMVHRVDTDNPQQRRLDVAGFTRLLQAIIEADDDPSNTSSSSPN